MKKFLKKGDGAASGNADAGHQSLLSVADHREGAVMQRKEQSMIGSSPRVGEQHRSFAEAFGKGSSGAGYNGLPEPLKTGIEAMSGLDLANVRVFYNSGKPAMLDASAYAQGNEIHVGPGQERWLPHEGWHIVQQRQGRVKPTTHRGGVDINDQAGLEREADAMGTRALHAGGGRSDYPAKQFKALNDHAFQSVYTQLRSEGENNIHGHFLAEDGTDMKNALVNKSLFLAMLRNHIEAVAEAELSAIGQTVVNCPYITYWFAYYQGLPAHEIERAVRLYAPDTREMLDPYEVIAVVVKKVQTGLQEQLASGTIDPVDKNRPSELREEGAPLNSKGVFQLGCCNTPEAVNDQVQPDQVVDTDRPARTRKASLDRRGNNKRDTEFESRLSYLIFQEKELYNVHLMVAQVIANALYKGEKDVAIISDENPSDNGVDMKDFVERHYAANNWDNQFETLYDDLRKDFMEDGHRGRDSHDYDDFVSKHTGIMTPISGSQVLTDEFRIPYKQKPGAYSSFKAPDPSKKTNPANDRRAELGLPFGAGPSGSLVYSLAMLRHFKMKNRDGIPKALQDKNIEIKYALSLAAYLVRHGHHSFFEAMVPLLGIDFESKTLFYITLIKQIGVAGFPTLQKEAESLFEKTYGR